MMKNRHSFDGCRFFAVSRALQCTKSVDKKFYRATIDTYGRITCRQVYIE